MCEKLGGCAFHPACEAESERGYASGMGNGQDKHPKVIHLPPGKETTHGGQAL